MVPVPDQWEPAHGNVTLSGGEGKGEPILNVKLIEDFLGEIESFRIKIALTLTR